MEQCIFWVCPVEALDGYYCEGREEEVEVETAGMSRECLLV